MKASELYQHIIQESDTSVTEQTICILTVNNAMKKKGIFECNRCPIKQNTVLLNFDAVKNLYCKNHKIKKTLSSADGVIYSKNKDNMFYFIEIKSAQEVLDNPKSNFSQGKITIQGQAKEFIKKSSSKLPHSIQICEGFVKQTNLFQEDNLQTGFVFVTDIDTKTQPENSIVMNLHRLREEDNYKQSFNKYMRDNMSNIPNRFHTSLYYTYCQKFDDEYEADFQNSLI